MELNLNVTGIILSFLTLKHLIEIYKLGNLHMNNVIANYSFDFYDQPIPDDVTLTEFRNMFPLAIGVNLSGRKDLTDGEFIANILPKYNPKSKRERILRINIYDCYCKNLDEAFVPLNGLIHTLNMSWCCKITDAAFAHLHGIRKLYMSWCRNITDAAFVHLRGVHTLDMSFYDQASITDATFANLRGVHTLNMSHCNQAGVTDATFAHLRGVHTLNMSHCDQITDAAFAHLRGVHTLDMLGCRQASITDAAFAHLRGVHTLDIRKCSQLDITNEKFADLGVHRIYR